jgi:hypothetical protein
VLARLIVIVGPMIGLPRGSEPATPAS